MITARERNQPTSAELDELLMMLIEAHEAGELVHVAFMLKQVDSDNALIDYRGSHEFTEIATRTIRERIALELETSEPELAQQIKDTTGAGPSRILVTH